MTQLANQVWIVYVRDVFVWTIIMNMIMITITVLIEKKEE